MISLMAPVSGSISTRTAAVSISASPVAAWAAVRRASGSAGSAVLWPQSMPVMAAATMGPASGKPFPLRRISLRFSRFFHDSGCLFPSLLYPDRNGSTVLNPPSSAAVKIRGTAAERDADGICPAGLPIGGGRSGRFGDRGSSGCGSCRGFPAGAGGSARISGSCSPFRRGRHRICGSLQQGRGGRQRGLEFIGPAVILCRAEKAPPGRQIFFCLSRGSSSAGQIPVFTGSPAMAESGTSYSLLLTSML